MRLTAQARLYLPGEEVFRDPGLFDKLRSFLGGDVDLRTGELAITSSALALTENVRKALGRAGINNAVTLLVDDDVVFQDDAGVDDDADLLVSAMRDASGRFERGFDVIRAVFEHSEAGLSSLLEATVHRVARKEDPNVTFAIGARIEALRPQPGEETEAARERIGKSLADDNFVPTMVAVLADLVARLEKGALEAFPRAIVEADSPEVSVSRPGSAEVRELGQLADQRRANLDYDRSRGHAGVYYDPWRVYYRDPMDTWVNMLMIDAMTSPRSGWGYRTGYLGSSWHSRGVEVAVLDGHGKTLCAATEVQDFEDHFTGIHAMTDLDLDTASWSDENLELYEASEKSWTDWDCESSAGTWDNASTSGASWDCSTDCSWDCSSDCSYDCSFDCSFDCSSDCSWD